MNSGEIENPKECILIVEDNPINQTLMQKSLNKKGFNSLLLAKNGREAIDLTLEHNPDLILMDIQLPDLDGNVVSQKLREKNYKGTIIAVSADVSNEDIEKSMKAGVDEYIFKPIDFQQLFQIIKKYLEKKDHHENSKISEAKKDDPRNKKKFKIPDSISEEVSNIFFLDAEEKLKTIAEVLKNDRFEIEIDRIKAIAHEYKGTASYFGMKSLERTAIELDEAFKRSDSIQQLQTLTQKLFEILKDIIDSNM